MVGRPGHWGMPVGKPLEEAAVQELAANLRGDLVRPEDDGYDAARAVFNGMIDERPAMIVRCVGTADVIRGSTSPGRTTSCFRCAAAGTASRARRCAMAG